MAAENIREHQRMLRKKFYITLRQGLILLRMCFILSSLGRV